MFDDPFDYNCAGFALNLGRIMVPYSTYRRTIEHLFDKSNPNRLKKALRNMRKRYDVNFRIVRSMKEIKPNEYAVAFRISDSIPDFHFMRRLPSGKWVDKRGRCPQLETHTDKEVFSRPWYGKYDSEIILLAVKKEKGVDEWIQECLDNCEADLELIEGL